jgi:hypothetical protein
MAASSAVLGPLLDGMHSAHGVLRYAQPISLTVRPPNGTEDTLVLLTTTWWTPVLFAVAGVILGISHPVLDSIFYEDVPQGGRDPSWTFVLLGISAFALQYWISAVLEAPLLGQSIGSFPVLDVVLCSTAFAHWVTFDRTRQGAMMAALTALAGPVVESTLISFGLYHYAHPQLFYDAIPSWIGWVYACGGPAVGNLGRKVAATLLSRSNTTYTS